MKLTKEENEVWNEYQELVSELTMARQDLERAKLTLHYSEEDELRVRTKLLSFFG